MTEKIVNHCLFRLSGSLPCEERTSRIQFLLFYPRSEGFLLFMGSDENVVIDPRFKQFLGSSNLDRPACSNSQPLNH
jgi:hypothetical protein